MSELNRAKEDVSQGASATENEKALSRRALLGSVSALAGGALLGGVLKTAAAQDAAAGTMQGGMQGGGTMQGGMQGGGMMTGTMQDGMMTGEAGAGMMDPTMMTASGGPIPGLSKVDPAKMSGKKAGSDLVILNSALVLEHLESEFYTRVVAADAQRPFLSGPSRMAAQVLQRDEATHVQTVSDMIRRLGGTPIEKPTFQFPGDVFISSIAFLNLSAILEENGVSAYLGAAPLVKNSNVLVFAASIYGNEARHIGMIHYLLGDMPAPRDVEMPITLDLALARANPFIVGNPMSTAAVSSMTTMSGSGEMPGMGSGAGMGSGMTATP